MTFLELAKKSIEQRANPEPAPPETPSWVFGLFPDDPEERAAILEYDGGLSRADAERRAGILN
jgi:hypothetical protein